MCLKDWDIKEQAAFVTSHKKIDWLISLISSIRSTKVDLNVSPGAFINISTAELSSDKINIIKDNCCWRDCNTLF